MGAKTLKEKEILEILRADKSPISLADLEKLISDASAIPDLSQQLIEASKKLIKNLKIQALADKMQEGISAFNIEGLTACMDDYSKFCVTGIDAELVKKVEDMLAEAKENPNFMAEKLAEQKKAGKKGKK